ncbi:MAG: LMBR1-like membrane protein [Olpidium bornovanus]|uniref:LMBR1-like membrane protein n=1 Tax=Olpidium bornovanus TaxID=278681 RepID=A0A8H7ZNM2_9FUNG|nr:MAG: LMBR1-like membrane protein [Olpidium bornovanus]
MSPTPVLLGGLAVLGLVVTLLTSYGNRKTAPYFVQLVALVSWLGPFCVPFLLSLDISAHVKRLTLFLISAFCVMFAVIPRFRAAATVYDKCSSSPECVRRAPFAYVSQEELHGMWSAIYWSAFCVTWGTIPVLQAYISSGGFDFRSKLRDALRANLVYYLAAGLAGGSLLVYIAVKKQIDTTAALRAVVMAASNAWGLTLIVLFLGYGLVAIPRGLWQSADTWWCLRRAEFRAAELQEDAIAADAELYEILQVGKNLARGPFTPTD